MSVAMPGRIIYPPQRAKSLMSSPLGEEGTRRFICACEACVRREGGGASSSICYCCTELPHLPAFGGPLLPPRGKRSLYMTGEHQQHEHDQQQADPARGAVTPVVAVRPS